MIDINITDILNYLPHRYPFILIDRVLSYIPHERLTAMKNVTINEPYFAGHFPDNPVMPGVLILEAMAQASVLLSYLTFPAPPEERPLHFFAGIDKARFKQVVLPGDQLELEVVILKHKSSIWKMHGEARVAGKLVCSADLLSAEKVVNRD